MSAIITYLLGSPIGWGVLIIAIGASYAAVYWNGRTTGKKNERAAWQAAQAKVREVNDEKIADANRAARTVDHGGDLSNDKYNRDRIK